MHEWKGERKVLNNMNSVAEKLVSQCLSSLPENEGPSEEMKEDTSSIAKTVEALQDRWQIAIHNRFAQSHDYHFTFRHKCKICWLFPNLHLSILTWLIFLTGGTFWRLYWKLKNNGWLARGSTLTSSGIICLKSKVAHLYDFDRWFKLQNSFSLFPWVSIHSAFSISSFSTRMNAQKFLENAKIVSFK